MQIELDLLENSYDYLYTSLCNYHIADEYGNHDDERSDPLKKQNWKIAYVTLAQALELLLKQILFNIHPQLINQDIDSPANDIMRTVTIGQAISRINSFSNNKISDEDVEFILSGAKLRNQFIHYKVEFNTKNMKKKYAALYHVYKRVHDANIKNEIRILQENQKHWMYELNNFTNDTIIFRGGEFSREEYKALLEDIKRNNEIDFYIDEGGISYKRIRYGQETEEIGTRCKGKHNITDKTLSEIFNCTKTYCGACEAKLGEYHLDLCDLEVCPKCLGQLITCGCFPDKTHL